MTRAASLAALCALAFASLAAPGAHAGPDAQLSNRLFDDANGAFLGGDLPRATAAYQALLEEGIASAELETNLATALVRSNKRGAAALHYERALFLEPGDDDARADLTELRRGNVDRLEGEAEESGVDALYRLVAFVPGRVAALGLVVCWLLACALFMLRALSPGAAGRLRTANWAALIAALVFGAMTAAAAAAHRVALQRAVVTAESAPAREGPQSHANIGFELHEGTLVRIEDEQNGFARVRLQNGLIGWAPLSALERVVPPRWN